MANDIAISENKFDPSTLSGTEKAAILLLSLSEQDAASIIRHLEPKQVQRVGGAMASMTDLSQEKVSGVHRLFLEDIQKYTSIGMGSEDFVRNTLVAALGEDKANNLVDQILMGSGSRGLDSLKWMDPRQVASIILNEHPQIHELNDIMEKQFAGQAGAQAAKIGGLKAAAEIMNYLDNNVEGLLMDQIRETDEDTATQIQDLMFVFDNLAEVDDRGIQTLLRDVPQDLLQKALKGADDMLRDKFFANMSKRASEMLREELEAMGPIRVADVEAAQKEILTIARRLSDSGEIMLGSSGGGADEYL